MAQAGRWDPMRGHGEDRDCVVCHLTLDVLGSLRRSMQFANFGVVVLAMTCLCAG